MPAPETPRSNPSRPHKPVTPYEPTPDGLRLLRRYHEATLQFEERRAEVRFIIDGATGRIVLPAESGMGAAGELVLHMPDEITRDLQLSAIPTIIERPESEEAVDRWQAYHGGAARATGGGRVWLRCEIQGAKRPHAIGDVYDPETIMRPNALRKDEFRLVRIVNTQAERLAKVCKLRTGLEVADPLCVGIDPYGLDVRARFGILRVEFDLEAGSAEQAAALIAAMLEKA
jgi:hypothetical protein